MSVIRTIRKNRKGINTILAALLMVVIVVVAAVMVYAWATGLLGTLLVNPNKVGNEAITMDSYSYNNSTSVQLVLRNAGSASISLQSYYIKDSSSNQWQNTVFTAGPISPNTALAVNLGIANGGTSGTSGNGCAGNCAYQGTSGGFTAFQSGFSYTVIVVTTRNNQFSFTVTR
jgi:flagellin-like protein